MKTMTDSQLFETLAKVQIGAMLGARASEADGETERDAYASIEVSRASAAPSDAAKTARFQRDTSEDFIPTAKFVREVVDIDETIPGALFSAPYELIDLEQRPDDPVPAPKIAPRSPIDRARSSASKSLGKAMDWDARGTLPLPQQGSTQDDIDVQQDSQAFAGPMRPTQRGIVARVEAASSRPFGRQLDASRNLVAGNPPRPSGRFEAAWFAESDDTIAKLEDPAPTPPARSVVVASVVTLLVGALAVGVGVAFLLM